MNRTKTKAVAIRAKTKAVAIRAKTTTGVVSIQLPRPKEKKDSLDSSSPIVLAPLPRTKKIEQALRQNAKGLPRPKVSTDSSKVNLATSAKAKLGLTTDAAVDFPPSKSVIGTSSKSNELMEDFLKQDGSSILDKIVDGSLMDKYRCSTTQSFDIPLLSTRLDDFITSNIKVERETGQVLIKFPSVSQVIETVLKDSIDDAKVVGHVKELARRVKANLEDGIATSKAPAPPITREWNEEDLDIIKKAVLKATILELGMDVGVDHGNTLGDKVKELLKENKSSPKSVFPKSKKEGWNSAET